MSFINHQKDFIDILAVFIPPVIALMLLYVAYLQWSTNEKKRKQDLFDKRHEFFEELLCLIKAIFLKEGFSNKNQKLLEELKTKSLLFSKEIDEYLEELDKKHKEMAVFQDDEGLTYHKANDSELKKYENLKNYFGNQQRRIKIIFEKYLRMEK